MKHISEDLEKLATDFINSPLGLPTGFRDLDLAIHGLLPTHLVVIGAISGCGKTSMLADIALASGVNNRVSIFSLEMPQVRMLARLGCALSKVNYSVMQAGKATKAEMLKFNEAVEQLKKYDIHIDDDEVGIVGNDPYWLNLTKIPIEKTLDFKIRDEVKKGCKLILIDYLQLLSPLKPAQDMFVFGNIALALRNYAKKYKICIVLFTQLRKFDQNRYDKDGNLPKPNLDDIKYSGDVRNHSDVVLLLHRPSQGKGQSLLFSNCIENDAVFILAKNRDGMELEIPVDFVASSMSWRQKGNISIGETI